MYAYDGETTKIITCGSERKKIFRTTDKNYDSFWGTERLQLKWFLNFALMFVISFFTVS